MKASGIYYYVIDESLAPGGALTFSLIVVGTSQKGYIDKLNRVTLNSLEETLGYDLKYNPNMYSLKKEPIRNFV